MSRFGQECQGVSNTQAKRDVWTQLNTEFTGLTKYVIMIAFITVTNCHYVGIGPYIIVGNWCCHMARFTLPEFWCTQMVLFIARDLNQS